MSLSALRYNGEHSPLFHAEVRAIIYSRLLIALYMPHNPPRGRLDFTQWLQDSLISFLPASTSTATLSYTFGSDRA
ncbi:hypothetical protein I7I48_07863 [Histoplasma ohiense]|nr:hypothetical protein I7I48_07863 [Histoplasma ohiense (nom. inval.)]